MVLLVGLALAGLRRRPRLPAAGCARGRSLYTPGLTRRTAASPAADGDAQRFLQGRDVPARWWTTFDNAELTRRVNTALATARRSPRRRRRCARRRKPPAPPAAACSRRSMRAPAPPAQKQSAVKSAGASPAAWALHPLQRLGQRRLHAGSVRRRAPRHRGAAGAERLPAGAAGFHLSDPGRQRGHRVACRKRRCASRCAPPSRSSTGSARRWISPQKQQQIGANVAVRHAGRARAAGDHRGHAAAVARPAGATRNQLATYLGTTPGTAGDGTADAGHVCACRWTSRSACHRSWSISARTSAPPRPCCMRRPPRSA